MLPVPPAGSIVLGGHTHADLHLSIALPCDSRAIFLSAWIATPRTTQPAGTDCPSQLGPISSVPFREFAAESRTKGEPVLVIGAKVAVDAHKGGDPFPPLCDRAVKGNTCMIVALNEVFLLRQLANQDFMKILKSTRPAEVLTRVLREYSICKNPLLHEGALHAAISD